MHSLTRAEAADLNDTGIPGTVFTFDEVAVAAPSLKQQHRTKLHMKLTLCEKYK